MPSVLSAHDSTIQVTLRLDGGMEETVEGAVEANQTAREDEQAVGGAEQTSGEPPCGESPLGDTTTPTFDVFQALRRTKGGLKRVS